MAAEQKQKLEQQLWNIANTSLDLKKNTKIIKIQDH